MAEDEQKPRRPKAGGAAKQEAAGPKPHRKAADNAAATTGATGAMATAGPRPTRRSSPTLTRVAGPVPSIAAHANPGAHEGGTALEPSSTWPPPARGESRAVLESARLELSRSNIGEATARSVRVSRGAIGRATAEDVTVSLGALGGARAQRVTVEMGALGGAVAGEVSIHQGFAQGILAREVTLQQAGARTVVANHVTMGPQSGAFMILARRVEGDVRTFLDWRGALAFGVAFGVVIALFRRRR